MQKAGDRPAGRALRSDRGRCAAAARSRSAACTAARLDPMPMMEMFDKGIPLRMGQAHVKRWIDDIMPLRDRRRRPARRARPHDAPAAARGGAARVRDVPGEEGRRDQGRAQAVTEPGSCVTRRRIGATSDAENRCVTAGAPGATSGHGRSRSATSARSRSNGSRWCARAPAARRASPRTCRRARRWPGCRRCWTGS